MESTNYVTTEVVTLTPAIAETFLLANTANRPINLRNVDNISSAIRSGEWKLNNDAICFSKTGALLNGQHRCYAVIKTGRSVPVLVIRGLEDSAFLTMDHGGKQRKAADALAIAGMAHNHPLATALTLLYYWINGWSSLGSARTPVSPSRALRLFSLHPEMQDSVLVAASAKNIAPQATVAFCHYILSRIDAEKADKFVLMLSTGANLDENHPVLALRNKLIANKTSKMTGGRFIIIGMIFKAWNAFVANKPARFYRPTLLKNIQVKGDTLWNSANGGPLKG